MLVREQMLLTVLHVSLAFAAVAELKLRICDFCPATDCTFMLCHRTHDLLVISTLSFDLLRRTERFPCCHKENDKGKKRKQDRRHVRQRQIPADASRSDIRAERYHILQYLYT